MPPTNTILILPDTLTSKSRPAMSVEVQWTDTDPETGERRFVNVERFAGRWVFKVRFKRRENWAKVNRVSRDMWETLLDALERRYQRREGVAEADVAAVKAILVAHREPEES
ncbi:hypothetical protein [Fimbriiglobus ruber]|nr:hypothetical protein [Fimbriiglobus ruber]